MSLLQLVVDCLEAASEKNLHRVSLFTNDEPGAIDTSFGAPLAATLTRLVGNTNLYMGLNYRGPVYCPSLYH